MWLCLNDGFISVTGDKYDPARLMIRARRKQILLDICGNDAEVIKNAGADYRWRTFIDRKVFSALVAARIDKINYTNFKNSVPDGDLHRLYMEFWELHRQYQEKDKSELPRRERGEVDNFENPNE
jgi:hypothetical protein